MNISETLKNTWGWHGTGRYQYNEKEEIVDVLDSILKSGGLVPLVKDPWLKIEGDLKRSISIAKIRMYSRIYADTMQFDPSEISYHYKSSRFWFWVIGIVYVLVRPVSIILHLLNLQVKKQSSGQLNQLISKYRKSSNIRKRPFIFKLMNMPSTDIDGNYGIIIGISDCSDISYIMDPKYSYFEHRIKTTIPLSRFTYIEVPESRMDETRKVLQKYKADIPLFSIEDVERFSKKMGFKYNIKPRV